MEDVDFTDDEICQELEALGYRNIPSTRFQQFKDELFRLIKQERSHNSSASSQADGSYYASVSSHDGRLPPSYSMHNATGDHSAVNGSTAVHMTDRRNDVIVHQQQNAGADQQEISRVPRSKSPSHSVPSSSLSQPLSTDRQRPAQRVMKRKVLRKFDGQTSICESVTESETSDGLAELQEQLRSTVLDCERPRPRSAPPVTKMTKSMDDDDDDDVSDDNRPVSARSDCLHQPRPHTACREQMSYNLPENYHGPKALIRPMSCEPHVQNIKKTDPVARYQTYRQCWTSCRAPGEKAHKQLRWGVREKMLYHDQVVDKKPQRSYQPNSYVVPSDKKRKTLRWQIRMDLAQGVKPPSMFD